MILRSCPFVIAVIRSTCGIEVIEKACENLPLALCDESYICSCATTSVSSVDELYCVCPAGQTLNQEATGCEKGNVCTRIPNQSHVELFHQWGTILMVDLAMTGATNMTVNV